MGSARTGEGKLRSDPNALLTAHDQVEQGGLWRPADDPNEEV
jgi:hypothetical protein